MANVVDAHPSGFLKAKLSAPCERLQLLYPVLNNTSSSDAVINYKVPSYQFGMETNILEVVVPSAKAREAGIADGIRLSYQAYCAQKQIENEEKAERDLFMRVHATVAKDMIETRVKELLGALDIAEGQHRCQISQSVTASRRTPRSTTAFAPMVTSGPSSAESSTEASGCTPPPPGSDG